MKAIVSEIRYISCCLLTLLMQLSLTGCINRDDIALPTPQDNAVTRKVAIVAPIGDAATKTRMERTANWFASNLKDAQTNDTVQIRLELEWYDELDPGIESLSRNLAGREDVIAIIGPFANENMALFAPACQKTHKPLIAPTVTSEDIMRRYAVSTAGNKEFINKESFFWPLCESDVALTETMLSHYAAQAGQNNLKCAVFSPADKYGQTFYDWAPFHARNLNIDLKNNEQYSSTRELLSAITGYQDGMEVDDTVSTGFCIIETTGQLYDAAQISKPGNTYFVFPSLSEEGLASLDMQQAGSLNGFRGFSPYADPGSGFESEYERRYGVMPTFAECKLYDALMLTGLAAVLHEHLVSYLTGPEYAPSMNEWINSIITMMCAESDDTGNGEALEGEPIWSSQSMARFLESTFNAEPYPFYGASGYIMFDRETCMQIARTTYVLWQINDGDILHKTYYGPNGQLVTDDQVSWENAYDEASALKDFADMVSEQDQDISYPSLNDQYAVLVQGSNGMNNYRHQADVLSVYQMLRQNGFDDDHIILIIDGALAYDPNNNEPGVIRNNMLGHDLLGGNDSVTNREWARQFEGYTFFDVEYPAAVVDYDTDSLDASDISDILTGKSSAHLPVVLPQDEGINVLLYWSGHGRNLKHGGTDELVWRETAAGRGMTASLLRQTAEQMKYRKILTIVEPCYSEGVIQPLQGLTGILAMSGASGDEQSWAENWNAVLGRYGTWMYDRFTRNVVNYLTDNATASYRDFYLYCMQNTIGSHVKLVNAEFFGNLYSTTPEEFVVYRTKN